MQKLYYQFPKTWFGDCMPFGHGDKFYLYHQRDTRKPGRISLFSQEAFLKQKDSIIFSTLVTTVIIQLLENRLRY